MITCLVEVQLADAMNASHGICAKMIAFPSIPTVGQHIWLDGGPSGTGTITVVECVDFREDYKRQNGECSAIVYSEEGDVCPMTLLEMQDAGWEPSEAIEILSQLQNLPVQLPPPASYTDEVLMSTLNNRYQSKRVEILAIVRDNKYDKPIVKALKNAGIISKKTYAGDISFFREMRAKLFPNEGFH